MHCVGLGPLTTTAAEQLVWPSRWADDETRSGSAFEQRTLRSKGCCHTAGHWPPTERLLNSPRCEQRPSACQRLGVLYEPCGSARLAPAPNPSKRTNEASLRPAQVCDESSPAQCTALQINKSYIDQVTSKLRLSCPFAKAFGMCFLWVGNGLPLSFLFGAHVGNGDLPNILRIYGEGERTKSPASAN